MDYTSEFSTHEILYMGSCALLIVVDAYIDPSARDPFDIVAEAEEEGEYILAHSQF